MHSEECIGKATFRGGFFILCLLPTEVGNKVGNSQKSRSFTVGNQSHFALLRKILRNTQVLPWVTKAISAYYERIFETPSFCRPLFVLFNCVLPQIVQDSGLLRRIFGETGFSWCSTVGENDTLPKDLRNKWMV